MATKKARSSGVKTHAYSSPRRLSVKGTKEGMEYRFVKKEDGAVDMRESQGWEVCHDKVVTGKESGVRETHDLILMEIPTEDHAELKKQPGLRSKARIEGAIHEGGEIMEKTKISNDHLKNSDKSDSIFEDNN